MTYEEFITQYPEFASVPNLEERFPQFLLEATMLMSRFCVRAPYKETILMKAIAHLIQLSINKSVGRVSSGTQGSTNVSLEYTNTVSGAYWNQTPYGAFIYEMVIKPSMLGGRYVI